MNSTEASAQAAAAPHLRSRFHVPVIMRQVLYALGPALVAYVWFFGFGIVFNCAVAILAALSTEYVALRLRSRPVELFLSDGSAIVTAVLLAFALPPLTAWWITALGSVFAIGVAKHLYGGLGANLFNPAMAGYVALLVSFPEQLTNWLPPRIGDLDYQPLGFFASLHFTLLGNLPAGESLDALTRATPLDSMKVGLDQMLTVAEVRSDALFGDFGGRGWEWINNYIALGGFYLLWRGVIRWHIPVGVLGGLLGSAAVFYLFDPALHPSPGFHLFSGGAMLCAFFIATDPVSAAATPSGRLVYGAGIGVLIYLLRSWGSYPDGVAFAVLLMNMAVPLLDRYLHPNIYGFDTEDEP